MGWKDRLKDAVFDLGTVGMVLVGLGIVAVILAILPVLTLWAVNHLNTAFGWGWQTVEIFSIKNILAVGILYMVLAGIFSGGGD